MKGLIAYSLYGGSIKYVLGMYEILDSIRSVYPGWDVRIYIEQNHHSIPRIRSEYPWVHLVGMKPQEHLSGSFWRFQALFDIDYSHVLVRDIDSRVTNREAELVKQWIYSGKSFHSIRDHPGQRFTPIIAGAFGCCPNKYDLQKVYDEWMPKHTYGDDEKFLKKHIYEATPIEDRFMQSSIGSYFGNEDSISPAPEGTSFVCEPQVPKFPDNVNLYVINAPHYKDRFTKFEKAISTSKILSNCNLIRVEGCTLETEPLPQWFDQNFPHYWLVSQDHKRVLKKILVQREEVAFIFEDDGHPNQYFDEYFIKAWNTADSNRMTGTEHPNWLALMLGGQEDWKRGYIEKQLDPYLARAEGGYGQHSVLWNWSGAKHFYDHAMYWNYESIDIAFAGFQRQSKAVYCPARWITDIKGTQFGKDH